MGFVVSTLLLIVIIIAITQAVLRWPPQIKDRVDQNVAVSRANALNKILLNTPGVPPDWSGSNLPSAIGLAEYNNLSNTTLVGSLDSAKLSYVNSSLTYFEVKARLGMNNDTDFYLKVSNSTRSYEIRHPLPGQGMNVVAINRYMILNSSSTNITVNVTLLVW